MKIIGLNWASVAMLITGIVIAGLPLNAGSLPKQPRADNNFKIGWATVDITPAEPVSVGGGSSARVFDGAKDAISATVLVLESVNGTQTADLAIMISVDLVAVSDLLKNKIIAEVRELLPAIDTSKIVVNATHTHAAPVTRTSPERSEKLKGYGIDLPVAWSQYGIDLEVLSPVDYVEFAGDRITAAVKEAWEQRQSGGISFGVAHALAGQNRLTSYFNGKSEMYGATDDFEFSHLEGYEDHSVNLLYTWDENKELTGVMINVAIPAQSEYGPKVSADYWHETRNEIHRRLGDDIFVFPQISAAGDLSPKILIDHRAEARMLKLTSRSQREQIAINISEAVASILPTMKNNIEWKPVFGHKVENIELSRRRISDDDIYTAKSTWHRAEVETVPETFERLLKEYKKMYEQLEKQPELKKESDWYVPVTSAYWRLMRASDVLDRYELERTAPSVTAEVHAIRIGDMVIATNPFELYIDFGMQMKARSNAVQTFVVQLAGPGTYVPTQRAVAGGAYGAIPQSNLIGPEGGRQLVNQTLELIDSLWEE